MGRVIFNYDVYSSGDIKRALYLNNLLPKDSVQLENVILTVKGVYLKLGIIKSGNLDYEMKKVEGKNLMIDCYSVIDCIVGCLGYKIQMSCRSCRNRNRCCNYSQSVFKNDSESNERNLFKLSNDYLKQVGILLLSQDSDRLYDLLRDIRNDVHLTRNGNIISDEKVYSLKWCEMAIDFLFNFAYLLSENFNEFKRNNGCYIVE